MDFQTLWEKGGYWLVGAYLLVKDIIPFLLNRFIPEKMKAAESQRLERVSDLAAEREWQHQIERERLETQKASEKERLETLRGIEAAVQSLSNSMIQVNTNVSNIGSNTERMLNKQDTHHNQMMEGITDMKVMTAAKKVTVNKRKIQ